jgi:hypothetical protein
MKDPRNDDDEPEGLRDELGPDDEKDVVPEHPDAPRAADADEEEKHGKQRRLALSHEIAKRWDPEKLTKAITKRGGGGQALDHTTRARFEKRLGVDLGDVRVYSGEFAEKVTQHHSAEAVTIGGTGMILMGGTADRSPVTASGQALLGHELTHVAQSARGMFRSAPGQSAPLATEAHEAEAEAVEAEILAGGAKAAGKRGENPDQKAAEMMEKITARVAELFYDEERVHGLRNGRRPTRS